jgi:short-subunit dehydrogenase
MKTILRGSTAVVSGAGSGIGRATALLLAKEGVRVHLADIDGGRAACVAAEIEAQGGYAEAHAVDIADPVAVTAFAESLKARGEQVEILVNNAGICTAGTVEKTDVADWRRVFGVNLFGTVQMIGAFVPEMLARGRGHVVNVASLAGLVAFPFVAPYTASKHALVGLSASMNMELSHRGVTTTAVCPGAVRTALYTDNPIELPGRARERIIELIGRYAIPPETIAKDIVQAIVKRRTLVVRAGPARPLWTLNRLAPRFFLWASRTALGCTLRRVDIAQSTEIRENEV